MPTLERPWFGHDFSPKSRICPKCASVCQRAIHPQAQEVLTVTYGTDPAIISARLIGCPHISILEPNLWRVEVKAEAQDLNIGQDAVCFLKDREVAEVSVMHNFENKWEIPLAVKALQLMPPLYAYLQSEDHTIREFSDSFIFFGTRGRGGHKDIPCFDKQSVPYRSS